MQELETIKLYEQLLLSSETESLDAQLAVDTSVSVLVAKCSRLLRMVLRLMGGEDPTPPSPTSTPPLSIDPEDLTTTTSGRVESRYAPELAEPTQKDWALEREIELARLEQENRELRMLLQAADAAAAPMTLPLSLPKVPISSIRSLMPRRSRVHGQHSFSSESSSGDFRGGQFQPQPEHPGLLDMSEEVL